MDVLLDTHAFVWWAQEDQRLSKTAKTLIASAAQVFVSVGTAWEMAIKVGNGKWPEAALILDDFDRILADQGFELLPKTINDVKLAGLAKDSHRDPFDRLLAAQAITRDLALVTSDRKMRSLSVKTVW